MIKKKNVIDVLCFMLFTGTFLLNCEHSQSKNSFQVYTDLLNEYPTTIGVTGDHKKGEIELVLDPKKAEDISKSTGRKVGIVEKDKYWTWINDPVIVPSGSTGVYGRLLWNQSFEGASGVAVLLMLPDGKIALNRNFRHATRSFEYELPRGLRDHKESIEDAAKREVKEETGMILSHLKLLGEMAVDSGLTNSVIPIFMAKVMRHEDPTPEESEAIVSVDAFSVSELENGFRQGFLLTKNNTKIPMRDSFLAYALLQAKLQGYLP